MGVVSTLGFVGVTGRAAGLGADTAGGKDGLVSMDGTSVGLFSGVAVTGFMGDFEIGTPLTLGTVGVCILGGTSIDGFVGSVGFCGGGIAVLAGF